MLTNKSHPDRIFLIGPMGAGKTTVGRLLAKNLGLSFADTDEEIEHRSGASVSWIFDIEGEAGFRDREEQLVKEIAKRKDIVISTGGGVILRQKNRQVLSARGFVIYLRASVEDLLGRMNGDKKRPLLQVDNPQEKIRQIVTERDPLYTETADFIIEAHGLSFKSVAKRLTLKLNDPSFSYN